MVIGNGLIANTFKEYNNSEEIVIFASGVSNSNEKDIEIFSREVNKINECLSQFKNKKFIYFSSCSLEDEEMKDTMYHKHKKNIELLIQKKTNNYLIFRLPNIIGKKGNKNTLVNFFYNKIKNYEEFTVWKNAQRNIVDADDLCKVVSYIIDKNIYNRRVINIAYNENVKIIELIKVIENILKIEAKYSIENKGMDLKIDNSDIKQILKELKINQPNITELIYKYKG